jgi:phosphoglycolate phosphatase-like HAD superfamily hydrolase
MTGAKPNLIMRLNAGIYRLVSVYGDANARVEADVTVEAGKLTEADIAHTAGKATFRLVTREGGEALPDTHWTVIAASGDVIKESVGALPTHVLAPGDYTVLAKLSGLAFKRAFTVKDSETVTVEVLKEGGETPEAAGEPSIGLTPAGIDPSLEPALELKNP